jgi:hypothetical protein
VERLAILLVSAVVLLGSASCGEPQRVLESGTMGTNGRVGDVLLRNVFVEAPDGSGYQPGDDATVRLALFSEADRPDTLLGVRSDAARGVEMLADRDCDGGSEPVSGITVPAEGATVAGVYHLRIIGYGTVVVRDGQHRFTLGIGVLTR